MDASPAITEAGGNNQDFPAEDTDKDEDLCRICRSPEEQGNPLRYPCACRGSIKYVHQDCLRLWLNRRGHKNCEVCGRSYSFVRVYSEDAPERLPFHEFLIEVLLRVSRYVKLTLPWILVILLNIYFSSLHPWGQDFVVALQRDFGMSWKIASLCCGLIYFAFIDICITIIALIRVVLIVRRIRGGGFQAENYTGNDQGQGVIATVVQVLWLYMSILSNWYLEKFLLFFLRERLRRIDIHLNEPRLELGAIRRMLFFLDDNAFAALAISIYMSILVVLVPFSVGWILLATVGDSYLSRNYSPVILGYMVILSVSFAYFTFRRNPFPAIVRRFFQGLLFISVIVPYLLWVLSVKAYENLSIFKNGFVLCLKLGVLPWAVGCWLMICTSSMFGTTIPRTFEIPPYLPWFVGLMCLTIAFSYMDFIQGIIHKRAFWYLLDVTDPDYKITKLNLGHTFFAFACHGILLVILLHLPVKAITLISPTFFPLEILRFRDENPQIGNHELGAYSVSILLMVCSPQWLIKRIKPASEPIVRNWIITVSSWLHLSDFLLQGEGFHRADQDVLPFNVNPLGFLLCTMVEGPMVKLQLQNVEDDTEDQRDNRFMPRIALMLVLAALSMFLVSTAFIALPILVGRAFFDSTSFIMLRFGLKHDDLCAFWFGLYILRAIYISICFVSDHIHKGRTDLLIKNISTWIGHALLFSIWISIIPGLLGLLIDLMIIIPSRVPLDESPVFFLFQDWLIGVAVLHIWTFLSMLTPINCFATESWLRKLERIRNDGIGRAPSMWLLRDVFGSMITTLLTTLCIPYLLVTSLFPMFGYHESVNSAVQRFIWPALLSLIAIWFIVKLTRDVAAYLHQLIFDERYVVGQRVDDLTDELVQCRDWSVEYDR